jgi:hypothetical protein
MVAASAWFVPALFSQSPPSVGLRAVVALASGLLAVATVLAARATHSRLAAFESAMSNLIEQARDLKARGRRSDRAR